ncbi:hypothetical protein B0H17DRAFT_1337866 [Mycena rosella]|uniref:F-box domain-containing protein n=1 Tax=Mycena rosella TaxID=1033263 RepID=A0AAD7G5D8_MYCRO|nr:hypothetical protein B0H17DRAFT_1337866 [Mycena rosella]
MSVKELQTRIEDVSADIDRQKQVLTKLERSRSALQRQLNAIRDPVSRLPLEISSEIFMRCLSSSNAQLGALVIPILFLNICNAWTDIALSTPALWATIHINFPCAESFSFSLLLTTWLSRARNCPLSLTLRGVPDNDVGCIVRQHTGRLRSLEIYSDDNVGLVALPQSIGPCPSLGTLTICFLPNEEGESLIPTTRQTLDILRLAPNLVECTLSNLCTWDDDYTGTLFLPSLRYLEFRYLSLEGNDYENDDELLKQLSLPALETLSLPMSDISFDDLVRFLKRSSSPLKTLVLGERYQYRELDSELAECLRLVPTITHLELCWPCEYATQMLTSLAQSPPLAPNLLSVKIRLDEPVTSQSVYNAVERALSVRRDRIVCFRLIWPEGCWLGALDPDANICNVLRRFVADGVKIHFGPEDRNSI